MKKSNFWQAFVFGIIIIIVSFATNYLKAQNPSCVLYGEIVALKIYLPNQVGFYYLCGEGESVYASRIPHYQWKIETDLPGYEGECITYENDIAIYNIFAQAYMVKEGNNPNLSTTAPPDPFQWRLNGAPLLEKFNLQNHPDDYEIWNLVIDYGRSFGFTDYSVPWNMEFIRLLWPEPSEVDFDDLRDVSDNVLDYQNREPRINALDLRVSPFTADSWDGVFWQSWTFSERMRTDYSRARLSGIMEKYSTFYKRWTLEAMENDWHFKIYPDEDYQWMSTSSWIPHDAEVQRSEDLSHKDAILVIGEHTPYDASSAPHLPKIRNKNSNKKVR